MTRALAAAATARCAPISTMPSSRFGIRSIIRVGVRVRIVRRLRERMTS